VIVRCCRGSADGAFQGVDAIPEEWIAAVNEANPETDMVQLAERLTPIIIDEYENARGTVDAIATLI